jgi:hypothetical protein
MRTFVLTALFCLAAGCGERVTIESGEVGKQLTTGGLEERIRQPGAFRMDSCAVSACPKLIRLQVNKHAEDMRIDSLFLPKSNVDLDNVEIRLQFRVKPDKASMNKVFGEVRPESVSDHVLLISSSRVYDTYLRGKVPDAVVATLREYTVEEVLTQVPEIAEYVEKKVNQELADEPVEVTELSFPNGIGEVPEAVIMAKRKLFAIEEEKARQVKALEAELAIEDQRQAVQRKRAKNDHSVAQELGMPVATFMYLKTFERFADAASEGTPVAIGSGTMPIGKGR